MRHILKMRDGGTVFLRGVYPHQKRKEERSPAWLAWKSGHILCFSIKTTQSLVSVSSLLKCWTEASKSPELLRVIFRKRQDELMQITIATNSNMHLLGGKTLWNVSHQLSYLKLKTTHEIYLCGSNWCLTDYCELSATGHTVGLQFLTLCSLAVLYDLRWLLSSEQHWCVPRLGWTFVLALYPPEAFFFC